MTDSVFCLCDPWPTTIPQTRPTTGSDGIFSLANDHLAYSVQQNPSYTTTPMWFWWWSCKRGSTVILTHTLAKISDDAAGAVWSARLSDGANCRRRQARFAVFSRWRLESEVWTGLKAFTSRLPLVLLMFMSWSQKTKECISSTSIRDGFICVSSRNPVDYVCV